MMRNLKKILKWISVFLLSLILASFMIGLLFIAFHYSNVFPKKNITISSQHVSHANKINCYLSRQEEYERNNPGKNLPERLTIFNTKHLQESQDCKNKQQYRITRSITTFLIKEYKETRLPILIIYTLLILILSISLRPFVYRNFLFQSGHKIPSNYEEFLINAPPMLGVLGTIFSLAYFMQQSKGDVGNISELLRGGFYDASLTTLIGGTVYLINLLIVSKMKKR